jgi:ribosomal protein L7/L12
MENFAIDYIKKRKIGTQKQSDVQILDRAKEKKVNALKMLGYLTSESLVKAKNNYEKYPNEKTKKRVEEIRTQINNYTLAVNRFDLIITKLS